MNPLTASDSYVISTATSSNDSFIEVFANRSPTINDTNFPIQKRWYNTLTNEEFLLTGFTSPNGYLLAIWKNIVSTLIFTGGTGTTGFPVSPNSSGQIQLTSTAGTLLITGTTNSINFDITGGSNAIETLTGNDSIVVSPLLGNVNVLGSGSITTVGTANTETISLTGLTNHSVLVGAGTSTITKVGPTANTGAVLQNNSGADPSYSTATYPSISGTSGNVLTSDGTNWISSTFTASYSPSAFVVSPIVGLGNYTSINAAITAATSGNTVFVKDGTYTEDVILKPGVNISALPGSYETPTVLIIGKMQMTATGTVTVSQVALQTNSDFCLVVSGSNNCQLIMEDVYFGCTNHTGISFTNSNALSNIFLTTTDGDIGTTGITLFSSSAAGQLFFQNGFCSNSGNSVTQSTVTNGTLALRNTQFRHPLNISSTGYFNSLCSLISTNPTSVIAVTISSNIANVIKNSELSSGNTTCLQVTSPGQVYVVNCNLAANTTNVFIGTGTIYTGGNACLGGSGNTVSTINAVTII